MTPWLALSLFLLAVTVGFALNERRIVRQEDRLWAARKDRLRRQVRDDSTLSDFRWEPGAIWIVDDPLDVQAEYSQAYLNMRGLIRSGMAVR